MNRNLNASISLVLLFSLLFSISIVHANEQSFTEAKPKIDSVRLTDPSLPTTAGEQKGSIGYIISRLFDMDGKISNFFLKIFDTSTGDISQAYIPDLDASKITTGNFDFSRIANVSITSPMIADNAITNPKVATNAAIAGTKISPNFGSQNIITTGNIGISIPSPTYKLDVAGDINFSGDIRKNGTILDLAGKFQDGATAGEIYYNGGNVGIGTNDPSEKLDITGDIEVFDIKIGRGGGGVATNTRVGATSLGSNTTGELNVSFGVNSLFNNTTGNRNIAIGGNTLYNNISSTWNTAVGDNSLFNNIGVSNTGIGQASLFSNSNGSQNTAAGMNALIYNTIGDNNSGFGYLSLFYNDIGSNNVGVGYGAGAVGGVSGGVQNTSSNNSTYIGTLSKSFGNAGYTNENVFGYGAVGAGTNSVVLGNDTIQTTLLKGNVGIGTVSPTQKLDVAGNVRATAFLYSSDRTLKTDITPYTDGKKVLAGIEAKRYNWRDTGASDIGVIAQDVQKVFPEAVSVGADGTLAVDYAKLVVPLIQVVKEQQKEIEAQSRRLDVLESQIQKLTQTQ